MPTLLFTAVLVAHLAGGGHCALRPQGSSMEGEKLKWNGFPPEMFRPVEASARQRDLDYYDAVRLEDGQQQPPRPVCLLGLSGIV